MDSSVSGIFGGKRGILEEKIQAQFDNIAFDFQLARKTVDLTVMEVYLRIRLGDNLISPRKCLGTRGVQFGLRFTTKRFFNLLHFGL